MNINLRCFLVFLSLLSSLLLPFNKTEYTKSKMNKCSLIELKMCSLMVHEWRICHVKLRRFIWEVAFDNSVVTVTISTLNFTYFTRNVASDSVCLQSTPLWFQTCSSFCYLKFKKKEFCTFSRVERMNVASFVDRWRHRRRALHARDDKIHDFTPQRSSTGLWHGQEAVKHRTELFMTFWTADFCA